MKAQNPSTSLGEGRDVAPSLAHPSQKQNLVVYTEELTHLGLAVFGLFAYLKNARSVTNAHLYTAISIYLLLGMQWFALYSALDVFYPGSILPNNATITDRQSELLYFSLVTLSTIGYGDVVPRLGEVRILAALEGITGVLYIAITVALLVSGYKQQNTSQEP
jgi:ion channel